MASTNSVTIVGSDFPELSAKGTKNPKNVAKLKGMLIADPGMVFALKLDYDPAAVRPAHIRLNWWIGYEVSTDYRYNSIVEMKLPNGTTDLEEELVFGVPFVDSAYKEQNQNPAQYAVSIGVYVYDENGTELEFIEIQHTVPPEDITGDSTFQFNIRTAPTTTAPPITYTPISSGENVVVYENLWFHPLGAGFFVSLPNADLQNVAIEMLPNGEESHSCKVTLSVLEHTINLSHNQDKATFWLPYAKVGSTALSSATIKVHPNPAAGIGNLTLPITDSNLKYQTGAVEISI